MIAGDFLEGKRSPQGDNCGLSLLFFSVGGNGSGAHTIRGYRGIKNAIARRGGLISSLGSVYMILNVSRPN